MGYDVHQLVAGRDLWMGGIKLEHELGLLGHSDADVLIHASRTQQPRRMGWTVRLFFARPLN